MTKDIRHNGTLVSLNGRILPLDEARIAPDDRGILLGDGLFESFAAHHGKGCWVEAHFERLSKGAALLKLPLPFDAAGMNKAVSALLEAKDLATQRAAVRLTVTRGSGPSGIAPPESPKPTILLTAGPAPAHPGPGRAVIVSVRRNEFSPTCQFKHLNYLDNILAFQEAKGQGADEGLLLNTKGNLCEGSMSNLFLVRGQTLYTPPAEDGALPGVTRKVLIKLAREQGLEVIEQSVAPDFIKDCEEVFISNSLLGVRALSQIGRDPFESTSTSAKLLSLYKKAEADNGIEKR